MAGSGSETRQRQVVIRTRVTDAEAGLVQEMADRAGVSVAALIRFMLFDQKPLRASRTPPMDRKLAARLLGELGRVSSGLRNHGGQTCSCDAELISAAQRDIADMRVALFQALGREP